MKMLIITAITYRLIDWLIIGSLIKAIILIHRLCNTLR